MVVRPWSHIVFKVVILAATMCSGVRLSGTTCSGQTKGKENGILGKIRRTWISQLKSPR